MSIDDRIVLAYALHQAITNPALVGDYERTKIHRKGGGRDLKGHQFRIGFANFILIEAQGIYAMYDLWLDNYCDEACSIRYH
jgi:hypothetical protein